MLDMAHPVIPTASIMGETRDAVKEFFWASMLPAGVLSLPRKMSIMEICA